MKFSGCFKANYKNVWKSSINLNVGFHYYSIHLNHFFLKVSIFERLQSGC